MSRPSSAAAARHDHRQRGPDEFAGRDGTDVLAGGDGPDLLDGGNGDDEQRRAEGRQPERHGEDRRREHRRPTRRRPGNDELDGGEATTPAGQDGIDALIGGSGLDDLRAVRRRLPRGSLGADTMAGGSGVDSVGYQDRFGNVTADLVGNGGDGEAGEGDDDRARTWSRFRRAGNDVRRNASANRSTADQRERHAARRGRQRHAGRGRLVGSACRVSRP